MAHLADIIKGTIELANGETVSFLIYEQGGEVSASQWGDVDVTVLGDTRVILDAMADGIRELVSE